MPSCAGPSGGAQVGDLVGERRLRRGRAADRVAADEADDERDDGGDDERAAAGPAGLAVEGHVRRRSGHDQITATAVPSWPSSTARAPETMSSARRASERSTRCGPQTIATRGSSVATPRLTAPSSTAAVSALEQRVRVVGDHALGVLGERDRAEAVDDRDGAGAVLAEHAVEVVAGDDLQAVLGHAERARRRRAAGRARRPARGSRRRTRARRRRSRPRAAARRAPRRTSRPAPSAARRPRRRMRARPRARARARRPAPLAWRAISARTSDSAAPIDDRISGCSGRTYGRPSAAGDLGRERGARPAERDDRHVGAEVVRARGVGDRVGDLVDRAVEQGAGGLLGRALHPARPAARRRRAPRRGRARPPAASGRPASARPRPRRRPGRRRRRGRARARRRSR